MTPKLYKAGEVCEAAGLQPYVLRSWEKEFPGIGVQRSPDSPRLYRQSDLDQVLRIKQLVFGEGLTLAGARRRMDEMAPRAPDTADGDMTEVLETLGADARARIAMVRSGLRSLLEALSRGPGAANTVEFLPRLTREAVAPARERAAPAAKVVRRGQAAVKPAAAKSKVGKSRVSAAKVGGKRKRANA